ncbi:MAG: terminase family protein, partial [Deltaproteobacteria bacterium]|nr:terminase family protein [Deltaproteobacteria bacterium]
MSDKVVWTPQPGPQTAFVICPYEEVLYGGSAGGGKSDALIGDFASGIEQYGGSWHGVLCRRSFPQLAEIEKRCLEIFSPHYGQSSYKRSVRTWNFDTDRGLSTLKLASIDDEIKVIDHQGHQYSWIGMDEATQWPSDAVIEYLITRLRSPKEVEGLGTGSPTYVRMTA